MFFLFLPPGSITLWQWTVRFSFYSGKIISTHQLHACDYILNQYLNINTHKHIEKGYATSNFLFLVNRFLILLYGITTSYFLSLITVKKCMVIFLQIIRIGTVVSCSQKLKIQTRIWFWNVMPLLKVSHYLEIFHSDDNHHSWPMHWNSQISSLFVKTWPPLVFLFFPIFYFVLSANFSPKKKKMYIAAI